MKLQHSALMTGIALLFPYLTIAEDAENLPAATELALAEPYIPSDDNQLLTLGGAKKERFPYKEITWPNHPGDADICVWADDKYAAVSITIDDNCAVDHEWWLEQCEKHNIKVTWFVITGGVEGKNKVMSGT